MNAIQRCIVSLIAKIKYRKKCIVEKDAVVLGKCVFEGKNKLSPGVYVKSVVMGYGSYIGKNSSISHAEIGRFCSIGDEVRLIRAKHPVDRFVSTHPAFYSTSSITCMVSHDKFEEYEQDKDGLSLIVGSDVWIGANVMIKAGKIGRAHV